MRETISNKNHRGFLRVRADVWICLFLTAFLLTVYLQVGSHRFILFDDDVYITRNHHIKKGLTPESTVWAFRFEEKERTYWHPLTWISHMLDCRLYGLNPGMHHRTNLILHMANTLLLFWLLRRMTGTRWRSAFVAVLFAIHPLNVDTVAWIAQRKNVLSGFFWMLTILAYSVYAKRPTLWGYAKVILLFCLGLLAKPTLVVLPFLLMLMDFWPLERLPLKREGSPPGGSKNRAKKKPSLYRSYLRLVGEKIPLLALSALSVFLSMASVQQSGTTVTTDSIPMTFRVANALVSYVAYIGKMVWPQHLAPFYPYPQTVPSLHVIGALLAILALSAAAVGFIKRQPYFFVGWFWYLGTLIPVIGLVQVGLWPALADRFTYLPMIGLYIIIVWGAKDLADKRPRTKKPLVVLGTILILALTVTSWRQVRYWKNSETLFRHSVEVTEKNYIMHRNLGIALIRNGDFESAVSHYKIALEINPMFAEAHNSMGVAYLSSGDLKEAENHFLRAIGIDSRNAEAHNNLGSLHALLGNKQQAVLHYKEALRLKPDYRQAMDNLQRIQPDSTVH